MQVAERFRVSKAHWPSAMHLRSISEIGPARHPGRRSSSSVVVCRAHSCRVPPRLGKNLALAARRHSGTCSTSWRGTVELFTHLKVEVVVEIVADALEAFCERNLSPHRREPMIFSHASQGCHLRRPRLCWTSFQILPGWERKIVPQELWNHVLLEGDVGNIDRWIVEGDSWPAGNEKTRLPAAVWEKPRQDPPFWPAWGRAVRRRRVAAVDSGQLLRSALPSLPGVLHR